ncbi:peptide chain release factor 2 [Candidatus Epulonipiscium fishelsonii]|nr:peptide chain release factor 2 [Epulopiscium sp. SCG-C06WGA-EpuloA1]
MKWGTLFDVAKIQSQIVELEQKSSEPDFWNDMDNAQKVLQNLKSLKDSLDRYNKLVGMYEDSLTMIDMGIEEQDEEMMAEAISEANAFKEYFDEFRTSTLLDGEYDKNNAILTLHSGAGGTEACDWNLMLFRMYGKWADSKGYKVQVIDMQDGDEAGIKSVTLQINGENAYGYLKAEKGIHRLVRISPFDSSGRRHTSFASCDVMPELSDDVKVDINPEDLRIDTYRSSGAGGQHVNTTDSAVRITHLPTGIVVQCQNERSQIQNKDKAMQMLKSKLFQKEREDQLAKLDGIRGEKKEIGWGSQIRSYVFHPYNMVKDHRTSQETGNTGAVMDGDIDKFISAYLSWIHQ